MSVTLFISFEIVGNIAKEAIKARVIDAKITRGEPITIENFVIDTIIIIIIIIIKNNNKKKGNYFQNFTIHILLLGSYLSLHEYYYYSKIYNLSLKC